MNRRQQANALPGQPMTVCPACLTDYPSTRAAEECELADQEADRRTRQTYRQ